MKGGERSPLGPAGAKKPWAKPKLALLHEVIATGGGAKSVTQQSYEGRPSGPGFTTYGPVQDLTPTTPGIPWTP